MGYSRGAMKLAKVTKLRDGEGYVARIPGFRGLLATGTTRKESLTELQDALADWIELSLRRGTGLPPVKQRKAWELALA
jgi:predicted RNase H-like HicB family nuclease